MAYKYQSLAATMSGSLTQEGDFTVKDHSGADKATIGIDGAMSGSGALSAGGNLRTAGTVRFDGVADAALAVASDSFYYLDSDGLMKRDTMADYATAIAGDGLAASSGVLAVGVDDSTIELDSDALRLKDDGVTGAKLAPAVAGAGLAQDGSGNLDVGAATNGGIAVNANDIGMDISDLAAAAIASGDTFAFDDSGTTKKESVDDLAALFAGDGLSASSAVISIATSGSALTIASDKLGISGSIAGDCLDKGPGDGVDSIRSLHVVADESTIEAVGRASLRIKDDGVTGAKLAPAVAGAGLAQDGSGNLDVGAATNGGIAVNADDIGLDLNDLSAGAIASGDSFAFVDANDSNASKKETVDDLATLFAGDGLSAASAVLSVAVSGALKVASDKVGISGSFAGTGIGFLGGVDSISGVELDLNELSAGAIADGDSLAFIDANDANVTKKEAVADLATLFAGAGLGAASSVISVANATNGGLAVNADDMQVDLNDLAAAAVDVANDSIAIIDANDSDGSKKESIADLVTAMAGAGLSATSGVLSVTGNNVALKADGDTLVEGYNYFADAGANATVSMPNAPAVGDVVTVKAGNLTSGAKIIINRQGSHTIDGLTSIEVESPFGAVTMVYVVANDWRIV
tara:strand:- start:5372 stop:7279 length:1908 start_codon:yes stop_codon:yes gene_type:complete